MYLHEGYEHVVCDVCDGIVGSRDRGCHCECFVCGKEFDFHRLKYDELLINDKTGWIFPMIKSEKGEEK